MGDLLEIVLENISRSKVYQLLILLLEQAGQITEIRCSEDIELSSDINISVEAIESFIQLSDDATLMFKLSHLKIAGCVIPSVLLRLVKYGDQYDIDFSFNESDITDTGTTALMKELQVYISELGEGYQIGEWFGGIEPASDEDTRYFTGNSCGPLR